ncbi:hypothetical protein AJ85_10910 [Alkalihalobacillus alcalophilus ATCC 27647 = CGMCC 1.3604]|uniref:Uncharacterized protein n=1 Tax=Alkalihalobacillus alcalophilus ATCC 27647 = CGMCC 1.3604 TaxID=1218173 RepID=A0A094WL51_ALKAL|nr:hypothetical protein [Alkalihalobacillus alcalophilus]KGA97591.1 hypothetical protein BALCAV_0209600 [Alkalihalobacillus alcalophilus ATCC 27647 = CGMCC 1.3604]MED1563362.1 hypothetical protein [Alkalihalobacillus alcalophilus]THG90427.1 hypothetical protein AJ85_10910 [Alkalihalobacillus alcalophilus ATCC 27647 = CGMCC 1.3604]
MKYFYYLLLWILFIGAALFLLELSVIWRYSPFFSARPLTNFVSFLTPFIIYWSFGAILGGTRIASFVKNYSKYKINYIKLCTLGILPLIGTLAIDLTSNYSVNTFILTPFELQQIKVLLLILSGFYTVTSIESVKE